MSDYYLNVVLLENCVYSKQAVELLHANNIVFNSITVDNLNKNDFKTQNISTFPQIYLRKRNNNGSQLLGGFDDLSHFMSEFKNKKYDEEKIQKFISTYGWSKKATLRLVQLIN